MWRGVIERFFEFCIQTCFDSQQKMNVFDKRYCTYRFLMSSVGLWPYHESVYRAIQRMILSGFLLSCLIYQTLSVLRSEITVQRRISLFSVSIGMLLCLVRYVSFICNLPVIKFFFDLIQTEEDMLEDSNEVQLLVRCFENSNRIMFFFLWVCLAGIMFFATQVFTPPILDLVMPLNESRTRYLSYFAGALSERPMYLDTISLVFLFCSAIGSIFLVCTESTLSVLAHYTCGLFKIASYRVQNAIKRVAKSNSLSKQINSNYSDFHRAVDIHYSVSDTRFVCDYRQLMGNFFTVPRYINIAVGNMLTYYLIASLLVVISFAVCLHRLFLAVMYMNDVKEVSSSITFVTFHVMFMYLNNYCGQLVIDNSLDVFKQSYNSTWYCIPLRAQKLLLFIMLRSSVECAFNLSGLFVPCHTGFSSMMSTSFSYFTMMYSLQ